MGAKDRRVCCMCVCVGGRATHVPLRRMSCPGFWECCQGTPYHCQPLQELLWLQRASWPKVSVLEQPIQWLINMEV